MERNRLITLLTVYEGRTLVVLAPVLLLTEAAMLVGAAAGGWFMPKVRGWVWLWRNRGWVARRRRLVRAQRRVPDGVVAEVMTARVAPSNPDSPPSIGVFNAIAGAYWQLARPLLRRR